MGEISRRELFKMASPLGQITLEKASCTGCGLCAGECATGAITVELDKDSGNYRLLFRHMRCVACNACVEICPEKCLGMERTLKPESINGPAETLFTDVIVRCQQCNTPIGSRSMIDSIKSKVSLAGELPSTHFELCPECKAKTHFTRL